MKIGFGIFCFGRNYYYRGAYNKAKKILESNHNCYLLTENPNFFKDLSNVHIIPYYRTYKSYYDKMILPKHILNDCDICILMDADLEIKDYSFLDDLRDYNFREGISYIDVLLNHPERKEYVGELNLYSSEWNEFRIYCENIFPDFKNIKLMWEYFLVINKKGFSFDFYSHYDKLQIKKESCSLFPCKEVNAPGEGISINISAKLSNIKIDRDLDLYNLVNSKIKSSSSRFSTNPVCNEYPKCPHCFNCRVHS